MQRDSTYRFGKLLVVAIAALAFGAPAELKALSHSRSAATLPSLAAVWGASPTDVFAVGDNGMILRYDGTWWRSVATGLSTNFDDVWGTSSADVYAVGFDFTAFPFSTVGTIAHYDGASWSSIQLPGST